MKKAAKHSSSITGAKAVPRKEVPNSAAAPTTRVPPTCQRRSLNRSELRLITSTPNAPKT